jgi:hypothetical protein
MNMGTQAMKPISGLFANSMGGTGHAVHKHDHHSHYHDFCPHCCHPVADCCCRAPQCRKEAKELLVIPGQTLLAGEKTVEAARDVEMATSIMGMMYINQPERDTKAAADAPIRGAFNLAKITVGIGKAFIGGGCCVHLSVEYALQNNTGTDGGAVSVRVSDSENTVLLWGKLVEAGTTYQIKENIITTYPGAQLVVVVSNVIARVRWCEVFSC